MYIHVYRLHGFACNAFKTMHIKLKLSLAMYLMNKDRYSYIFFMMIKVTFLIHHTNNCGPYLLAIILCINWCGIA